MRILATLLNGLLLAALVLFSIQNLGGVTISFLTFSAKLPLALLVVLVYLLGIATGYVFVFVRGLSRKPRP